MITRGAAFPLVTLELISTVLSLIDEAIEALAAGESNGISGWESERPVLPDLLYFILPGALHPVEEICGNEWALAALPGDNAETESG